MNLGAAADWVWRRVSTGVSPDTILIIDMWRIRAHLYQWAKAILPATTEDLLSTLCGALETSPSTDRTRARVPRCAFWANAFVSAQDGQVRSQESGRFVLGAFRDAVDRWRSQRLSRPALPRGRRALRGLLGAPRRGGLSGAASNLTCTL